MKIVVDSGELRSGVPEALRTMGAVVEVSTLDVADYLVGDGVGAERKTIVDLHRSIAIGRLWRQLLACRRALDRTYLIVEGSDLDQGCLTSAGVRGALLEIGDRGVTVVRSKDHGDTAQWLVRIAARLNRPLRHQATAIRRAPNTATPLTLLLAVPGIGPRTARNLLERFGSLRDIASADLSELQHVDGIGPRRAAVLVRILSERP